MAIFVGWDTVWVMGGPVEIVLINLTENDGGEG